jgi:glycosyltransferase involved in cell wall biosynthesis
MGQPLIAIVTPTYNGARYLGETLESVQQQDYPNLVHVILDNCSSDGTPAIIDQYIGGRVPIIRNRNPAVLDQRQNWTRAFELAPQDAVYIRYLCDDDTITPSSISEMAAVAEAYPSVGVVGCLHDCAGAVQDFFWPAGETVFDGIEAARMTLLRQGVLMPVQMLWRKTVMDKLDPVFSGAMGGGWDLDTVFRMLAMSDFGFVHRPLGFTRVHDNTMTAQLYSGKTRAWTRDGLHLLMRHGPTAFGTDYQRQLATFRRYYIRRIVQWWREDHGRQNLQPHLDALSSAGFSLNVRLLSDAVLDWIFVRIGFRHGWRGYPGWQ